MNRVETPPRRIVAVVGSGQRSHPERAIPLGHWLAAAGVHLVTGGGGGVMAEVARAFCASPGRPGLSLGILPADPDRPGQARPGYPNPWVELALPTHLPLSGERGQEDLSRNHLVVLAAQVVVALPGGPGTLSEVLLAQRYNRPVAVWLETADEFPGLPVEVPRLQGLGQVARFVEAWLAGPPTGLG